MAPPDASTVAYSGDFFRTVTAAVADITRYGYDSPERIARWVEEIRRAAISSMISTATLEQTLTDTMRLVYRRLVDRGELLKLHPGIGRFMLQRVEPRLHAELQRRILASADLIKLNRQQAIEATLRRFSGWATSIPAGGSNVVAKNPVKTNIRKSLAQLPYEERRVLVDQGHKLRASLSAILATDGGAIAGEWHSHWRQAGYDYREDHRERDGNVYALRGNWAIDRGLMRRGRNGYTDEITDPGEEVFCRCFYRWIYALRDLPDEMVTKAGKEELKRTRMTA